MKTSILTIVIMTRNRVNLLTLALRSVFECQTSRPYVIVSDNSTEEEPEIDALRRRYGFTYIRQSGKLSASEHHNVCLTLASSPWIWLLHDDDELYPEAVSKMETFLGSCEDVGVVVGGVQYIDSQSIVHRQWVPAMKGTLKGEEGLLALGLDWGVRAPSQIFNVRASRQLGGFSEINGLPADYAFALLLAYSYGVAFRQDVIGRYREGIQQISCSPGASQEKTEAWLLFVRRLTEPIRTCGCSIAVADRIRDYMTWELLWHVVPRWLQSDRSFAFKLTRQCLEFSPQHGKWQNQVRADFPFLFWRPVWLAWPLYTGLVKLRCALKTISGGWSEVLIRSIKPGQLDRVP